MNSSSLNGTRADGSSVETDATFWLLLLFMVAEAGSLDARSSYGSRASNCCWWCCDESSQQNQRRQRHYRHSSFAIEANKPSRLLRAISVQRSRRFWDNLNRLMREIMRPKFWTVNNEPNLIAMISFISKRPYFSASYSNSAVFYHDIRYGRSGLSMPCLCR